jgi:hypothetical protein
MLAERQRAFIKRMHTVFVFNLARCVPLSVVIVNPHPWVSCSEAGLERRIPLYISVSYLDAWRISYLHWNTCMISCFMRKVIKHIRHIYVLLLLFLLPLLFYPVQGKCTFCHACVDLLIPIIQRFYIFVFFNSPRSGEVLQPQFLALIDVKGSTLADFQ